MASGMTDNLSETGLNSEQSDPFLSDCYRIYIFCPLNSAVKWIRNTTVCFRMTMVTGLQSSIKHSYCYIGFPTKYERSRNAAYFGRHRRPRQPSNTPACLPGQGVFTGQGVVMPNYRYIHPQLINTLLIFIFDRYFYNISILFLYY